MFSILLTPMARYVAALISALVLLSYGIHVIKQNAVIESEAKAKADALRRIENAVRSGDSVDTSPDGLLKTDGYRRE